MQHRPQGLRLTSGVGAVYRRANLLCQTRNRGFIGFFCKRTKALWDAALHAQAIWGLGVWLQGIAWCDAWAHAQGVAGAAFGDAGEARLAGTAAGEATAMTRVCGAAAGQGLPPPLGATGGPEVVAIGDST